MVAVKLATESTANGTFQLSFIVGPPCSHRHTYPRHEPYVALARRRLFTPLAFPDFFGTGSTQSFSNGALLLGT
jgi:hypothetical protein